MLVVFDDFLAHPMLRPNDDRAERTEVGVRRAAIIHRHAVEAGGAERFHVGRDFFQMPAERFFAFVETANELKSRQVSNFGCGLCSDTASSACV